MLGVAKRVKVRQTALLNKYRGQHAIGRQRSTVVDGTTTVDNTRCISADLIHAGDAEGFYLERRWFGRFEPTKLRPRVPTWDRLAHALIVMTRPGPRVVPEAAFRLFAVFFKMTLLQRIAEMSVSMAPLWMAVNAQNVLETGLKDKHADSKGDADDKKEKNEGGSDAEKDARSPAASDAPK